MVKSIWAICALLIVFSGTPETANARRICWSEAWGKVTDAFRWFPSRNYSSGVFYSISSVKTRRPGSFFRFKAKGGRIDGDTHTNLRTNPVYSRRLGITYESDESFIFPSLGTLNDAIKNAENSSPLAPRGLQFYPGLLSEAEDPVSFMRRLGKGELPINARNNMTTAHDIDVHLVGYLALPDEIFENMKTASRVLTDVLDDPKLAGQVHDKAEELLRHYVASFDQGTAGLNEALAAQRTTNHYALQAFFKPNLETYFEQLFDLVETAPDLRRHLRNFDLSDTTRFEGGAAPAREALDDGIEEVVRVGRNRISDN